MAEERPRDLEAIDAEIRALLRLRSAQHPGAPEFRAEGPGPARRPPGRTDDPKTALLVGGRGMMGRFLADRLLAHGHLPRVLDAADWPDAPYLVPDADLVLLCVPLDKLAEAAHRVAPLMRPHAALADIGSIKAPILATMLAAHSGPVMGLHPMFGPGVESFLSQRVIACPGRGGEAFDWLLDLVRADGGTVVEATAEEHDRVMTTVQAIRHFATFSLGAFLAAEEPGIARTLEFSSPIYRLELDLVCRLFGQDPALYADIMTATPERIEALRRFAANASRLAELAADGGRSAIIAEFNAAARAFGPGETRRALDESARVIRALARILAEEPAAGP